LFKRLKNKKGRTMDKLFYEFRPFFIVMIGAYAAANPFMLMEHYAGLTLILCGMAILAMRFNYRVLRKLRN
jgi:hypothetical protein